MTNISKMPEIGIKMRFDETIIHNRNIVSVMDDSPDLQAHFKRIAKEIRKRDTNKIKVQIIIRTTIEEIEEE